MGSLTRRSLLGGALAGGGALFAPGIARVLAAEPDGEIAELPLHGEGPQRPRRRFDLLAIEWEAPAHAHIELRVRTRRGFGPWVSAPDGHDRGDRLITDPVWAGGADAFEVRSSRPLRGARAHLVTAAPAPFARAAAPRLAEPHLAAGPGQPRIIARTSWATPACRPREEPFYGSVDVAFLHHTAGATWYRRSQSPAIVRSICLFHRNVHRWNDIGYNFVIDRYGQIFEGRLGGIDEPLTGAHAGGYNLSSTGVALLGTFESIAPTQRAMDALAHLLAWKLALHGVEADGRTVVEVSRAGQVYSRYRAGTPVHLHRIAGHRDGDATSCPGAVLYRGLPALRRRVTRLQGPLSGLSAETVSGTTLSGILTTAGTPVAGATVELQRRLRSGEQETLTTATTGADGSWWATVALTRNAAVRAIYRGAPGISAVVSPPVGIDVAPQITLTAQSQQAAVGIPLVFSGTIAPSKRRVTIVVAQGQPDGTYREMREVRVAVEGGAFSRGIAFSAPGQYQVTARSERDATNAPGASVPIAMSVA
jgi:hypothetical protein